jgi:isoleucyl-tRNA synthetase
MMKQISGVVASFTQDDINTLETEGSREIDVNGEKIMLLTTDVEITTEDIPGWVVANDGKLTVALDITLTEELRNEGHARELVNKIQNIRKEKDFDVTDKISVILEKRDGLEAIVETNFDYICSETLTSALNFAEKLEQDQSQEIDLTEGLITRIAVEKK